MLRPQRACGIVSDGVTADAASVESCRLSLFLPLGRLAKRATSDTLRHSCPSYLLEGGYDIRTVQNLFGDNEVETTVIHSHVLRRARAGVQARRLRYGRGARPHARTGRGALPRHRALSYMVEDFMPIRIRLHHRLPHGLQVADT